MRDINWTFFFETSFEYLLREKLFIFISPIKPTGRACDSISRLLSFQLRLNHSRPFIRFSTYSLLWFAKVWKEIFLIEEILCVKWTWILKKWKRNYFVLKQTDAEIWIDFVCLLRKTIKSGHLSSPRLTNDLKDQTSCTVLLRQNPRKVIHLCGFLLGLSIITSFAYPKPIIPT